MAQSSEVPEALRNAMRSLHAAVDAARPAGQEAPEIRPAPIEMEDSLDARLNQPLDTEVHRRFGGVEILETDAGATGLTDVES
eukprot:6105323-Karenia_brevis.AAC.1